jgi:hypothetical protein
MSLRGPAYDALTPGTMPGARALDTQATHADDPQ